MSEKINLIKSTNERIIARDIDDGTVLKTFANYDEFIAEWPSVEISSVVRNKKSWTIYC